MINIDLPLTVKPDNDGMVGQLQMGSNEGVSWREAYYLKEKDNKALKFVNIHLRVKEIFAKFCRHFQPALYSS